VLASHTVDAVSRGVVALRIQVRACSTVNALGPAGLILILPDITQTTLIEA
jgi:hypothetical protein